MSAPASAPRLRGAALEEVELVRRAQSGDADAFGELDRCYRRLVTSVVTAETRRGSDPADIVQDVFVLAWRRIGELRDPDRFRPWVLQITRRVIIDQARRNGRRPTLDADDDLALEMSTDTEPTPEELAELADTAQALHVAIDGLSRRDATAITLSAQLGFGPAEIAEALNITPGNAKVVLHRARARLRAALADQPGD